MGGELKTLLVHRKGSTRAFPPHHPLIPVDYQLTGQPVLIGGTMGVLFTLPPLGSLLAPNHHSVWVHGVPLTSYICGCMELGLTMEAELAGNGR